MAYQKEDFEIVIGLEIHAQISTKTKMFSADSADYFGKEPNTTVSEVSMGFPGQLPVLNQEAVKKGVRAAMALNCQINKISHFDRKNYFYPDLPKGYQISQFEFPVSQEGFVQIKGEFGEKTIRLIRLHLEEDAGKLTHIQGGSLIDFNRSGVGLMEIVSYPDLRSAEEAVAYAKAVQMILRYADSSDADMEKGMMRFDASVSIRPKGEERLYPRAEIKNLNSFRSLELAIKFEANRQIKLWQDNNIPTKETTVGYDDSTGQTYFMRNKEGSDDYRYFPEPDLPPLYLDEDYISEIKKSLPELPDAKYRRYIDEFGLSEAEALFLIEQVEINRFFDQVFALCNDSKKTATFVLSILLGRLKKDDLTILDSRISPVHLAELIDLVNKAQISLNIAKGEVFEEMYLHGKTPTQIVEEKGLKTVSNEGELTEICQKVLAENPKIAADFLAGKDNAFKALVGQVMKVTRGQANAVLVNEILLKLLKTK